MEPADKRRKIDADELEDLIKRGENDRLKSITQNPNNASNRDDGLLHMAVKHNNLDMLNFLLTLGRDVNARDSSGSTPLLLAASNNNFEAVKRLLDTDADVCVSDATGKSTFEILMDKIDIASADLVQECLQRFSVSKVDPQTKARILLATRCSLRLVVSLKDAAVTQTLLDQTAAIDDRESAVMLGEAMNSLDVESVRALLHHGPGTDLRKRLFLRCLSDATRGPHPNLRFFEAFIRVLVDLDVLDHDNVGELRGIAISGHVEAVRMLLQHDIDVYARKSFGYHLVPYAFYNARFDAIELLKDRHFDVNGRTETGTALQWALRRNSGERIQYLLDLGADPNAKPEGEGTPIIDCQAWGKKCLGKLFLQHGADVQAVNEHERTVFNMAGYKHVISCILPQLAIVEAQGTPILQQIREKINRRKIFRDAYAIYCKQVDGFKKYKLSRTVTLLTVLAEKTEVVARLLRDQDKISLVEEYCRKKKVHSYYSSTLVLKLQRASNVYRAKCNVVMLVSKYSGREVDSDHLVVEKIFGLLRYYDMVKLASV